MSVLRLFKNQQVGNVYVVLLSMRYMMNGEDEVSRSANWVARSPRSANTPADRSKRAPQLSPGAALPAFCLVCSGRLEIPYTECSIWCTGQDKKREVCSDS